ncbi:MAG: hypothetical protein JXO44_12180, partial [Clostridia bacterium]|nr:hypothetical protein [Clostridia bacterium]
MSCRKEKTGSGLEKQHLHGYSTFAPPKVLLTDQNYNVLLQCTGRKQQRWPQKAGNFENIQNSVSASQGMSYRASRGFDNPLKVDDK